MKVTRNLPEQLIVENRPWVVSLALVGGWLLFFGIGLSILLSGQAMGLIFMAASFIPVVLLYFFARRTQALFLRSEGKLVIRRKTLLGGSVVEHQLHEVQNAIVQASHTKKGGTTYRVALVFPEGQSAGIHPLVFAYDNFSDHHGIADTINQWLTQAS
ncbi:hypothetical protein SAMN05444273_103311 [Litoreibacter ascidiaceicola]|uniref:PH domain-containing protein n=1 Tax=Litoreibacter ascidiaceicola TaxID=1486859 RepID=A0A1M4XVG5_9RHOB|nr:hypothetical protein [Litoreibacter ascidiaceicola]SHE97252.1 hypothetical protein SAMN05444273_103311 [Litoreibacter ascidiaceicola]